MPLWFGRKNKERKAVNAILENIALMLSDDEMQLRILGPQQYAVFKSLTAIDAHRDAEGDFGTNFRNPIPTNGPIGSLAYLSNLNSPLGYPLLFHRINSIDKIDIYEYVSFMGVEWGLLFVDMYHSRKSRLVPNGFARTGNTRQLSGFNHYWEDFPFGFAEQKHSLQGDIRLLYCTIEAIANEMRGREFSAPEKHRQLRSVIASAGGKWS
jgi:hypothetical protein